MHLLYVDGSGGDDASAKDRFFVLGGISAFERVPYHLCADVDEIQTQFFPTVSDPIEFRASAIWNGNGQPWESMARPVRIELLKAVYGVIARETKGVILFGIALHKPDYPMSAPIQRTCEEMAGHSMLIFKLWRSRPSGEKSSAD